MDWLYPIVLFVLALRGMSWACKGSQHSYYVDYITRRIKQ